MFAFYRNGNYNVMILNDGTKIRQTNDEEFVPDRIESMDIKITNRCDIGCPMCHEDSIPDGEHALLNSDIIDSIPEYTELAIGGGNPLEHPQLTNFLMKCQKKKLICNITVNSKHFIEDYDFIKNLYDNKLIHGIGVSIFSINDDLINKIKSVNGVCHTIVGMTSIDVMSEIKHKDLKVLVLGYKNFRRGETFYNSNTNLLETKFFHWEMFIKEAIHGNYYTVLSFDNLALQQLSIKNIISKNEWDMMFMGDDGINRALTSGSMYIDLVKKQFAKNSCAVLEERYNCSDFNNDVNQMFKFLLDKYNNT